MKMEERECSEPSAYKIQTQRNYPEERIQQHWLNSLRKGTTPKHVAAI
jgi:hypothetical protein